MNLAPSFPRHLGRTRRALFTGPGSERVVAIDQWSGPRPFVVSVFSDQMRASHTSQPLSAAAAASEQEATTLYERETARLIEQGYREASAA